MRDQLFSRPGIALLSEGCEALGLSGWAFFGFQGEKPAAMIPAKAGCIACHEAHGAVDTTFVQFYPTLLPRAQELKTLSAAYLKDAAGQVASAR